MTGANAQPSPGSSPYSTGGGGTVLEHRYGAVLLGYVLTGDPMPGLGDDAEPLSVRFQASADSPVDDLLVVGRTPDGGERRMAIGVRRAPALVTSDTASARLLASYIRVLSTQWTEVQAGRWRLGLAVASPNPAVQQLRELCGIARATNNEAAFRTEVARPGRTTGGVRDRLVHVDALVEAAATEAGVGTDVGAGELTWRLLSALYPVELRLQGADESDRTAAVARLRTAVSEGTPAAANDLFARLAELSGRYAPAGADVTEVRLRQDLSGVPLARSASRARAWSTLDGLTTRLRDRTGFQLRDQERELELERAEPRQGLAAEMTAVGTSVAALVVHGEPDVGKSALTLRTADEIAAEGAAITALSLRDLPPTTLELETVLGAPLVEVFAATAVETVRLLVIDGAESVLEGRVDLLTEVATAALRAGLGVVAVTRTDGKTAVVEALNRAAASASRQGPSHEQEIARLTQPEIAQLAATFPSLTRVGDEPRAAWLLGRLGLVDPLLRAGAALDLPEGPLSEADLFAVIWKRLVRRGEVAAPGAASPDMRERALVSLARKLLLPGSADLDGADALGSLRSDGLLLAPGPTSAWSPGDQFASDLIRDFAVAKLLISEGWGVLEEAGAPRWALRAVRLACQAQLVGAGAAVDDTRRQLEAGFADLASRHGERWAEVPLEAMLTLGSAREVLTGAWPELLANDRQGLRTLLRLALQRYSKTGFGDTFVLAPLVELAFCGEDDLGQHDRYGRAGAGEAIRDLVPAWLRGLAMLDAGSNPLRQRVRDRILGGAPDRHDDFAVEALAMLGPDLDASAEGFLRGLADDGGAFLAPAVESIGPMLAMSSHQPELLLALSEAYYIEQRDEDGYGWGSLDDGIRDHYKKAGFGMPMAAWYFGPFFRLLNTRPVDTIAFINRMLDHAAAIRVQELGHLGGSPPDPDVPLPGLDLDLPGAGVRHCVGDSHVWSWYRGSSVGPYPCMSALFALERFADHLVDTASIPLATVAELVLRDCHSLAMPGFVVGLLVRHMDQVGELLDRWLVLPEIWHLEFSRALAEHNFTVQGRDAPEVVGRDRRGSTLRDVASEMTIRAMLRGDRDRLAALAKLGDDLVGNAQKQLSEDEAEDMVAVRGWAAVFHIENYRTEDTAEGRIAIRFEAPEDVAAGLAPSLASLARGNEALRLQNTYGRSDNRVGPVDTLIADLAMAHELLDDPPSRGPLDPLDSVAAVAAAAIVAVADDRCEVPAEELGWAAEVLIEAARQPQLDHMSYEGSIYSWGADRSAAVALPLLLLPVFDSVGLDRVAVEDALRHISTSLFDEVRSAFVIGAARVWPSACGVVTEEGECRHALLLSVVQEGLRDCRLGGWNQSAQRRLVEPLEGPYEETLPTVETDSLRLNRLAPPLVAAAGAVLGGCCVAGPARRLLDALMEAHRRASDHWATKGYGGYGAFQDAQRPSTVRVLADFAVAGDSGPLTDYVRAFSSNARALERLLHDLSVLFTYDADLRPHLAAVWRRVMVTALDAVDAGADFPNARHWSEEAVGGLLPNPQITMSDSDVDATLERAQQDWLAPDEIADLMERWLPLARREPKSVDAVVRLARCTTAEWQVITGLEWVERVIDGRYDRVAGKCWYLVDWLETVRASGRLNEETIARWRRIVDGLAAEGDDRAVRLQQAEE